MASDSSEVEWEAAWHARVDRRLPGDCKIALSDLSSRPGRVESMTISVAPPAFADRVWCPSGVCPVCGQSTADSPRTKAMLDVQWADGFGCFVGAWVHDGCLDACPVIGPAEHIPW